MFRLGGLPHIIPAPCRFEKLMSLTLQTSLLEAEQSLHDAAIAACGFDDFGHPHYRDALQRLLCAYDEALPAGPSPARDGVAGKIVELLIRRLYAQAGHRQRPEARNKVLRAPVFILGMPRTGTTALQHMLARDPQFQGLNRWLAERPMPRPPRQSWSEFAEFQHSQVALDALFAARPAIKGIHYMAADEVDECSLIMTQTFASTSLAWSADLGGFTRWLYDQDLTAQYQYYADVLRLISVDDDRTWLLKCPHHAMQVEVLLAVFPDARIVFTHREPVDLIPSISSLTYEATRDGSDDGALRARIGARHMENLVEPLRRAMAVRKTHPGRIFDIRFRDFMADPLATARTIYEHFGIEMTPDAESAMQLWCDSNPKGKHGGHKYSAEDFGLTVAEIQQRFAFYEI